MSPALAAVLRSAAPHRSRPANQCFKTRTVSVPSPALHPLATESAFLTTALPAPNNWARQHEDAYLLWDVTPPPMSYASRVHGSTMMIPLITCPAHSESAWPVRLLTCILRLGELEQDAVALLLALAPLPVVTMAR